jgi:hypothetical protein
MMGSMERTNRTLKNRILHLAASKAIVKERLNNPEQTAIRALTCADCPHRVKAENPADQKCGVCGCFLSLKTIAATNYNPKVLPPRSELTHCPLGKWGDLEIANTYREMDGKTPLNFPGEYIQQD